MIIPDMHLPAFPPLGFPLNAPRIHEHPVLIWRNRNQGSPASRDDDFRRSIRHVSMKKSLRSPSTGMLPDSVHQARVMNEMKETLGYDIGFFGIQPKYL